MSEEVRVDFPDGMTEKEFWLAREVTEADAIINLCIAICKVLDRTLDELFWPEE